MKRNAFADLLKWQHNPIRKPLILKGISRVGKTWLLRKFGDECFESTVYFNFSNNYQFQSLLSSCSSFQDIVSNLSRESGCPIIPGKTLIILDEIVVCNQTLTLLECILEGNTHYHIVCTESPQRFLAPIPHTFPVGKYDFLIIKPLTFVEFLETEHLEYLVDYLYSINRISLIPLEYFKQLLEKLRLFLRIGGMPEPIHAWIKSFNLENVSHIQQSILKTYESELLQHSTFDNNKIYHIFNSVPRQLLKNNIKFFYSDVRAGARAREYANSILQLQDLGMVHKIHRAKNDSLSLSLSDDKSAFKLFLPDIGLFHAACSFLYVTAFEGQLISKDFENALMKSFVLQELTTTTLQYPRYWSSGLTAELDFIILWQDKIIPIEIAPNINLRSKKLHIYRQKYNPSICIRFSFDNLSFNGSILNIPLFLAGITDKILESTL